MSAPTPQRAEMGAVERAIERILMDVCELPDRTSPDDAPEMMLVSGEELDAIVRQHLGECVKAVLKDAADLARNLMICRTKVNRDGSIVQQCRTPTAAEISKAIRARAEAQP